MPRRDRDAQALERFRPYLLLLVRLEVDSHLQGKLDASGIVQQTLLEAHQSYDQFRGRDEAQLLAWLRQILAHNLADQVRKLEARKRDVRRERSLHASLDESAARMESWLAAEQSSAHERAVHAEQMLRLALALEQLPPDQRNAVEMHHLKGMPLADVATELGRSKGAAAQLVFRGLRNLRQQLEDSDESTP